LLWVFLCLNIFIDMMKIGKIYESLINEIQSGGYRAYHGTPKEINKFVDDFVGGEDAHDQEGPGIYFTTDFEDASGYGSYIYSVRINGDKFLDDENPASNVDVEELVSLIKMSEDWEMNAQDWAEDPEHGAYEAAHSAIQYNDTERDVFQQIWVDFYRYKAVDYVRNMVKLGYDGMVVTGYRDRENIKHIIVYNPSIIEVIDLDRI